MNDVNSAEFQSVLAVDLNRAVMATKAGKHDIAFETVQNTRFQSIDDVHAVAGNEAAGEVRPIFVPQVACELVDGDDHHQPRRACPLHDQARLRAPDPQPLAAPGRSTPGASTTSTATATGC